MKQLFSSCSLNVLKLIVTVFVWKILFSRTFTPFFAILGFSKWRQWTLTFIIRIHQGSSSLAFFRLLYVLKHYQNLFAL